MSAGAAGGARTDRLGERVYQGVKTYLLSVARPGQRLDVQALAKREKASLTPVRSALHRLTGEGLVEAHLSSGFRSSPLSNAGLRDLYDWNRKVLLLAASGAAPADPSAAAFKLPAKVSAIRDVARLFETIARQRNNLELERAVARLNDRLHRVRMFEPSVLGDGAEELREMASHLGGGDAFRLGDLIEGYHQRRLTVVGDLIIAMERGR